MKREKLMLIINPVSGVNDKRKFVDAFVGNLSKMDFDVDIRYTQAKGDATSLANLAVTQGYGSVVVCGGDGTVNEAACALAGTGVVMGIIPSGSGNGLARHLDIPIDEIKSLDVIRKKNVVNCDCGIVNGKLFFCTFGIGFDASVSARFAKEHRRGRMTYIKNVVEEFANYQPQKYIIVADGERLEREAFLVACCNASQYGNNAFIAPEASVTDGQLDLVIIKSGNVFQMLLAGFDMITGMIPYNNHIETIRVKHVEIEHPEGSYAHIDGEPIDMPGPLSISCLPNRLKIYANTDNLPVTPFLTPIDLTLRDWGLAIGKLFK